MENYSVLMSIYAKENARYLKKSIESMLEQTVAPAEFVIVCDGALTEDLEATLSFFCDKYSSLFRIVRCNKNRGLGEALRTGLQYCTLKFVVRMDGDDIAHKNRCEEQLALLHEEDLDVCSCYVEEIQSETEETLQIKKVPLTHVEIMRYIKWRNPFNHPGVVFRKEKALAAGGYRDMPLFEDYDLWIRMMQCGARFGNSSKVLLRMRVSEEFYERRGGRHYLMKTKEFWKSAYRQEFIGLIGLWVRVILRAVVCCMPNALRRLIYQRMLREKHETL